MSRYWRNIDPELEMMWDRVSKLISLGKTDLLPPLMQRYGAANTTKVPKHKRQAWLAEIDELIHRASLN